MGIALLTLSDLFTPLQSLTSRWMRPRAGRRGDAAGLRYVSVRPTSGAPRSAAQTGRTTVPQRTVRVVRVVEPGRSTQPEGRVVIAGRMADVCAELDRLAALEAAAGHLPESTQLH